MTTSLPTTSSNEIFPGAAAPAAGSDGLAALLAPGASAAPSGALAPDFCALLDGGPATESLTTSGLTCNAPSTASASSPPVASAAVRPDSSACVTTLPTDVRGLALKPTRVVLASVPAEKGGATPTVAETEPDSLLPDRATLEAIVALLAPLAVVFDSPPESAGLMPLGAAPSGAEVLPLNSGEQNVSTGGAAAWSASGHASVTVTLPGQPPIQLAAALSGSSLATASSRSLPAETEIPAPLAPANPTAVPSATIAAPEAQPVSTSVRLPRPADAVNPARVAALEAEIAPPRGSETAEAAAFEATASVELTNGAVVALALPTKVRLASGDADSAGHLAAPGLLTSELPEKSAALPRAGDASNLMDEERSGKNFLSSNEQQVTLGKAEAGIGVAQERLTMFFTPHDTLSTVHPAVPALVSTVAAAPQAAGAPAPEPMPQLVAVSMAHRAVETVTNVVEAQAASKLQPVPSVQLKFKIGHEDLAVRVALRDGVVHTEFRTDSPELRAALQQEWKAVTAQPESALRYLEPVVSAASSSQSGTNSFGQPQQQSPGQSAAQQQQQQQQHQQARAAAEFFGSVARSTPFQPREGGAASTVAAALLPTSVHLSAVA